MHGPTGIFWANLTPLSPQSLDNGTIQLESTHFSVKGGFVQGNGSNPGDGGGRRGRSEPFCLELAKDSKLFKKLFKKPLESFCRAIP